MNGAVRDGHLQAVAWYGSPEFAAIKLAFDEAWGPGRVYFRVVDGKVNAISLIDRAPKVVGIRTHEEDSRFVLSPWQGIPTHEDLITWHKEHTAWMRGVSYSDEGSAVARWLNTILAGGLQVPALGKDWVFLNQEWNFNQCHDLPDVIAVYLPTGQIGIVEAKADNGEKKRQAARNQLATYQAAWLRDGEELAPLFTDMLQANARLYGCKAAESVVVTTEPAHLFFAYPWGREMKVDSM